MTIATVGIDLGKNSCSVAALDGNGAVVLRRRVSRGKLTGFVGRLPTCVVAMEACCGAHHLGRVFEAQGHAVRLMSPEYVQPYVKAQKNDDRDAEAIAEAGTRPTMRFVAVKQEAQLDMQTLHRARSRVVNSRTRLINQLRAILLERGVTVAKGRRALATALAPLLDGTEFGFSPRVRMLLADMRREWDALDTRIATLDREFVETARHSAPE
jgi:transposase